MNYFIILAIISLLTIIALMFFKSIEVSKGRILAQDDWRVRMDNKIDQMILAFFLWLKKTRENIKVIYQRNYKKIADLVLSHADSFVHKARVHIDTVKGKREIGDKLKISNYWHSIKISKNK